jgi:anti-anti-sigma factor
MDGADMSDMPGLGVLKVVTDPTDGPGVVMRLSGELDLGTVPMFVDAMADVLGDNPPVVELDLSELTFIDSSGVGAYVTAFRRAKAQGTNLSVGPRSPLVQRVLELSGVEEALAAEAASSN